MHELGGKLGEEGMMGFVCGRAIEDTSTKTKWEDVVSIAAVRTKRFARD